MKKINEIVENTGKYFDPVDDNDKGMIELKIIDGKFSGCTFYYGAMKFDDTPTEDGSAILNFERTITNDFKLSENDELEFNVFLGDLLILMITEGIEHNTLVYKGGV